MILPDVNVLIYAFRKDVPQHAVCRPWLDGVVSGDARFGMTRLALSAVVRITTDPRIYKEPSTLEEAFRFCDNLFGQRHCQVLEPGERHWDIFRRLWMRRHRHARPARHRRLVRRARDRMGLRVGDDGPRLRAGSGAEMGGAGGAR